MTRSSLLFLAALAAAASAPAATIPELYVDRCAHCHLPGIAGAPKVGDTADWTRRVRPGVALLYRSALEGMPNSAMAAKGGHKDLSDADVKALVDYMLAAANVPADTLKAAARYEALRISNRDFIRLDRNFDGHLAPDEMAADPDLAGALRRFDENKDGRLSEPEYSKAEAALERERAAVQVDDATLVAAVRTALAKVKSLPPNIKVESAAGVVTVTGVVDDAETARQAYAAIRRIKGIKRIEDRLVSGHLLSWD